MRDFVQGFVLLMLALVLGVSLIGAVSAIAAYGFAGAAMATMSGAIAITAMVPIRERPRRK